MAKIKKKPVKKQKRKSTPEEIEMGRTLRAIRMAGTATDLICFFL